jgi:hypothetical protein
MTVYSFVSPFREAKFCDVPSRVFDKLECSAGGKSLRNTELDHQGNIDVTEQINVADVMCENDEY